VTAVLALDVGTSSVRAGVFDENGSPLEGVEAQTRYELTHGHEPDAEFDADHLVDVTAAALEEVRGEAAGVEIDAICASCFWHSLVPVDARGRASGPLLTWRDTRSADAADRLARRLDPEAVHARTGCLLHPSFWPAKLAWLAETDPDGFARASRFLSFADYLYLRLAGEGPTSLSTASATGLLDLNEQTWDAELLEALGVDPGRLPAISDDPVGVDVRWFPALGDGACSNVGAGCLTRNRAALMIGTSGAYRTVFEADRAEPRPGLFLYRLDGRRLVEGGSLSDGGNLYAWLVDTLRLPAKVDVAALPPDGHGLTFLTLLGGERSPGWNARARGAVAGLHFGTTPADLLQAALEGIAYRVAEIAELMPEVHDVVATGAALLADRPWIQVFADVLARPVSISAVPEASLRGAAVVTLERLGLEPEPAPVAEIVQPRPERFEAYRAARERAKALYAAVT
jgi:gluconokinase